MSISLWCSHKEEPLIKNDQIAWIQKLHREPIIDTDVIPFSFLDGYVGQLKDGSWFISNRVKFGLSVPNFQTTIMGLDMDIRVDIRSHSFNHIHAFHKRLCKPLQKGNAENLNQDQKFISFQKIVVTAQLRSACKQNPKKNKLISKQSTRHDKIE